MPQCRSIKCGRYADDDWAYCAFCGEPLWGQPPADEDYCDHEFVMVGRYCIRCGYDPEVGGKTERRELLLVGCILLAVGFGAAVFSVGSIVRSPQYQIGDTPTAPRSSGMVAAAGLVVAAVGISKIFKALRLGD